MKRDKDKVLDKILRVWVKMTEEQQKAFTEHLERLKEELDGTDQAKPRL